MRATRPGIHAFSDAARPPASNTGGPVVARRRERPVGHWSGNSGENAQFVQGALNALHETEGVANVGIYASPGVWNSIVGNYQPDVPYWMADYLRQPERPGLVRRHRPVADHGRPAAHGPARDRPVRQPAVRRGLRLLDRVTAGSHPSAPRPGRDVAGPGVDG